MITWKCSVITLCAAFFLGLAGCTPRAEVVVPVPSSEPTPLAKEEQSATLRTLVPRVTTRRREAAIWEEGTENLPLFLNDAVQTHETAAAEVSFSSGTSLHLQENTHLVIGGAASQTKKRPDLALMQNGTTVGKTQTELWLIRGKSLFRLKPKATGSLASATYSALAKGRVEVLMASGSGNFYREIPEKNGEPAKIEAVQIVEGKQAVFEVLDEEAKLNWEEAALDSAAAQLTPSTAPSAELSLDIPPDSQPIKASTIDVKGKVGQPGSQVRINGQEVVVKEDGTFSLRVKLKVGANRILVQLVRPDGKSVYQQRVYLRKK